MKKRILSITLIALTFAIASTVDAKQMAPRQAMLESTSTIKETAKDALAGTVPEKEIINIMQQEAQTPSEQKTPGLVAREEMLKKEQELINLEIKNLNYGYFGFGTSKDTQEKYKKAVERLQKNQVELKNIQADISTNKKETGMTWYNSVKYGVTAAILLGISAAAIYDMYYGKGYIKGAYKTISGYWARPGATITSPAAEPQRREMKMKAAAPTITKTPAQKRIEAANIRKQKALARRNAPGYQAGR